MIVVAELTKTIGPTVVLQEVSLEVKKGDVAVIIGPSGGGKSTLLRCINGLETFQSGHITVGGLRLDPQTGGRRDTPASVHLRRQVGMVFQQFHLFPHLSVLGNVMAGPRYALGQSIGEAEPFARELLRRVGLEDKIDAWPDQLSGGQQQRVAIARCLAVRPAAILFDEPTSALDPRMADEVLSVMSDLASAGQTMIVVTHLMGFARRAASTVHVMCAGRLVESGTPAQVFDNPGHDSTRALLRQGRD